VTFDTKASFAGLRIGNVPPKLAGGIKIMNPAASAATEDDGNGEPQASRRAAEEVALAKAAVRNEARAKHYAMAAEYWRVAQNAEDEIIE
jgi:hypothetical protein